MSAGDLIPKVHCKWTEDIPESVSLVDWNRHWLHGRFGWKYNSPARRKNDKRGFVFMSVRVHRIRESIREKDRGRLVIGETVSTVFGLKSQTDLAIRVAEKLTRDLEQGKMYPEQIPRRIDLFNRRR